MIKYKTEKIFNLNKIQELFLSVNWSSGQFPEKLVIALQNSDYVISAWNEDELAGLINAISDKIINVYYHYLLVKPEYQNIGIGKTLIKMMNEHYADFQRKGLIAYNEQVDFYKACGFIPHQDKTPLFITDLTT